MKAQAATEHPKAVTHRKRLRGELKETRRLLRVRERELARVQRKLANLNHQMAVGGLKETRRLLRARERELARSQRKLARLQEQYRVGRTAGIGRRERDLSAVVEALSRMHRYNSLTRGVENWELRWEDHERRRVVLIANVDYAGSLFKWCAALNQHTDIAARTVVFKLHRMGEPGVDLLYPFGRPLAHLDLTFSGLVRLLDEADIIHLKDQTGFVTGENGLPRDLLTQFGKPIVFTHYGGNARLEEREDWYREHVLSFDARVGMTPDLCFEWAPDWRYIPHAIDTDSFPYEWQDGHIVGHSPSRPERKGTAQFLEALGLLDDLNLRTELIKGVPHDVCIALKRQASLFFDQAGRESPELGSLPIGWYANSALEAAVFGIPTMAYLSEQAFLRAERAGITDIRERCAILNCGLTAESMAATMRGYFEASAEERRQLSESTRAWIEDFHSYEAVARQLASLYDDLLAPGGSTSRLVNARSQP